MRDKKDKDLMKQVGLACGVPTSQVSDMVENALDFITLVMKRGLFEGVKLPAFGTFWVKKLRVENINNDVQEAINNGAIRRTRRKDSPESGTQAVPGV